MSPQHYEYLLVAANMAQFHPKWGFSIKILKWKVFFKGHRFLTVNCMGTMEVSSKKVDLNAYANRTKPTKNREQCHFIRIGILHHNSPRKIEEQMGQDGQLITPPLPIERNWNKNTIIWKNSGSIYMEFHFREGYG